MLAQVDILVNLLPLTPATRGLLCAARFDALPPGAALVNLARGAHVVDADLLAALDAGRLRHAVLDVFATGPLPPDATTTSTSSCPTRRSSPVTSKVPARWWQRSLR